MYHHTQRSPAALIFLFLAALIPIGLLVSGVLMPNDPGVRLTLFVVTLVMLTSAFVFSSLTIEIRNAHLSWWFGPGVVKKTVPLSNIASATPTTTGIVDGWGIHLTMRGWLYNIAGRQAVLITQRDGKRFLVGSDEPERLAEAIMTAAHSLR